MSEKFENEVLRMLKNHDKDIKKVLEKVDNLEKGQERLEERQGRLEANQERLEERQGRLETKQENFEMTQQDFNMRIIELYKELKEEVTNNNIELTKLSNHFTAFEFDINRKVDLLLENYDFDRKQFVKTNADIFNLQEKYSRHDDIIKILQLKAAMP